MRPKLIFGEHARHRLYKPSSMAEGHFILIAQLTSDAVLDAAYDWLCRRRREYPDHADIWVVRRDWGQEKPRLRVELGSGCFRFGLLERITTVDDNAVDLWSARDALVLKALTIVLSDILPVSPCCTDFGCASRRAAGPPRKLGTPRQPVQYVARC
jgi:hypothetical protein